MRRTTTTFITAAAVAGVAAAETRAYDLAPFTGIETSAGVTVAAAAGSEQSVIADVSNGDFDRVDIKVRNGVLEVSPQGRNGWFGWGRSPRIIVTVAAPSLDRFEASSGSRIDATALTAETIRLKASSGAEISLEGACTALSAEISSGADVDAEDLLCETAEAEASSGGSIDLHASTRIAGEVSSGASIRANGAPTVVEVETRSGGSLRLRD